MQTRFIKHYLPVFFALAIGLSISYVVQNNIIQNEKQKLRTEFETLTSTLTLQLQGAIDKQVVLTSTLSHAISVGFDITKAPHFNTLIKSFMDSTPGIEAVFIVSPKNRRQGRAILAEGKTHDPFELLSGYDILFDQRKRAEGPLSGANTAIAVRPLGYEENGEPSASPSYYLVVCIDTKIMFGNLFKDVMPDWLDMVIYKKGEDGQPQAAYAFSKATNHKIAPPADPRHTNNPFAIYLEDSIVTNNNGSMSVLYQATNDSHFRLSTITRWAPLSTGAFVSLLLAFYLLSILRRNDTVNLLVANRTRELSRTTESLHKEFQKRQELVLELSKSEEQLKSVMNSVDGMFWERDLINDRFNFVSDHVITLMGFTQEDVYQDVNLLRSRLLPEYERQFIATIDAIREGDGPQQIEAQTKRADGRLIWVRIILSLVFEEGRPTKARGVTMDVTKYKVLGQERAKLVENITQSQQELSSLVNSIDGVLWKFNINPPKYTYASKQIEHFFGCSVMEMLSDPDYLRDRILPEDVQFVEQQMDALSNDANANGNVEFRMQRDDGKIIYVRNLITPVVEDGKVTRLHGVLLDITREKKMQEEHELLEWQLKQAQKLEAIGQLAAGIAHEINTPTQFVGDNICYLQDSFEDIRKLCQAYSALVQSVAGDSTYTDQTTKIQALEQEIDLEFLFEDIPASISQSLEGTSRIRDIVKAMKEFSHPGSSSKEHIDLNHAIASTITVARNEWKYVAEVTTEFAENLPTVKVLPGEFNQVILNILVNAAHAIDEQRKKSGSDQLGEIKIRTAQENDSILISISDTGGGIPDEIKDRVFDPFFTTKEVGKGTGQGLAIAYSVIVDKHAGQISMETSKGKGTTFLIRLPAGNEEDTDQLQPDSPTAMAS